MSGKYHRSIYPEVFSPKPAEWHAKTKEDTQPGQNQLEVCGFIRVPNRICIRDLRPIELSLASIDLKVETLENHSVAEGAFQSVSEARPRINLE